MKNIITTIVKNPKAIPLLVICLILLFVPLFYGVRYYNTDDVIRRQLLVGSEQFAQSEFLIMSSSYIGKLFILFYNILPNYEWYLIINVIILITCLAGIFYYTLDSNRILNFWRVIYFIIFLLFIGRFIITQVHFTVVSSVLSILSAQVVINNSGKKFNKFGILLSILLLTLGFSFRFESATLAFFLFVFIFIIYNIINGKWKDVIDRSFKNPLLAYISVFILSLIVPLISRASEPQKYNAFHQTLSDHRSIFDFKLQENVSNSHDVFSKLGWKEGHHRVFFTYVLPAADVFSPNNLRQAIKELENKKTLNKLSNKLSFNTVYNVYKRYILDIEYKFIYIICILIPIITSSQSPSRILLAVCMSIFIIFIAIVLLGIFLKYPPEYVTTSLFTILLIIPLCYLYNINKYTYISIIIVGVLAFTIIKNYQSETIKYINKVLNKSYKSTVELPNNIKYLCLSQRLNDYVLPINYDRKHWWRKEDMHNAFYFGPLIWHPANKISFSNNDLVKLSVERDDYYWILSHGYENDFIWDKFDDAIIDYYKDQYGIRVRFKLIDGNKNYQLYKLLKI